MLTTKTKVAFAGVAYRVISLGRSVVGKSDQALVERDDIRWQLDLGEGFDLSIYLGAFEPGTRTTLKKLIKPGNVVFDIGANIGAHTLGIAQSVGPQGHVFAFEPTDFAFEKLCRNLALNPDLAARTSPRQILLAASSSDSGEPQIYASWPLRSSNDEVHPKHRGRLVCTAHASVDTLDSFVQRNKIDRLNLIKIDVDGHELPVLQGALETLRRFRPLLVMEMSPYNHAEHKHSFGDFVALLKSLRYSLQDADTNEAVPLDLDQLQRLIPDGASINVLAMPDRSSL
jgi:FkbM family methyltransferase